MFHFIHKKTLKFLCPQVKLSMIIMAKAKVI